ncbi:MAG TPA: hypothetical protein VN324_03550, partial [Quisquiliibacterium sp.]|nr:hypothetical protein [Quisquiliibacterium sp.]
MADPVPGSVPFSSGRSARVADALASLRAPAGVSLSVRVVEEESYGLSVVRGVLQPLRSAADAGAMV